MEDNLTIKYIVYLTINSVNNKIYIGVHKTTTPYKFKHYLGCGVKTNDRSTYRNCRTPFETAVNKYGPDKFKRVTLKVFDTLDEALEFESYMVDEEFVRRRDTYNVALGGGIPPTITKTIYQYSLEGEFIKEWPSITEASIYYRCSSSSIGRAVFDRTPSVGYLWTEYKYDNIDLNDFHIDENKTTCYIYNIDGTLYKEFKSIHDAAKDLEISAGSISNMIKGKYCYDKQYYASDIKYDLFPIPKSISYDDGFYQYDLDGNYLNHFNNIAELQKHFNKKNVSSVHRAIRTGNTAYGYQWSNVKLKCMKKLTVYNRARKIGKYTQDGELVKVFNSVREAKKDTCGAPNALKEERKTAGGFIWKYLD